MSDNMLLDYTSPVKKAEREIVGRETEMRRVKAALMRPELCNVMLLADAGSGKANPVDTKVAVYDWRHFVRLDELSVGDYVYDEYGKPVQVLGIFPQGFLHAYEITLEDGRTMICSDEHLWNVRTSQDRVSNRDYMTVTYRYLSNVLFSNKIYIPRGNAMNFPEHVGDFMDYTFGAILGIRFSHEITGDAIEDCIASVLPAVAQHIVELNNGFSLADCCKLYQYMLSGPVEDSWMVRSIEQRRDFLRGFMDVAGHVTCDSNSTFLSVWISYDADSPVFCFIRNLAASLGLHMRIEQSNWDFMSPRMTFVIHDNSIYSLFWREDIICFLRNMISDMLREGWEFERDYHDVEITSVRDLHYETEMLCIYVDSPEHLFRIGPSYIVTHNTALVQGLMLDDSRRKYLEVDLSRMIADSKDSNEMAAKLKLLFDQVAYEVQSSGTEIVLFIDEFHQIVQLSAAAVEALKPLLADSGTRGIRVIAATTYIEFRKWISPNQPLVERLQRINLPEPNKETVIAILKGMAYRYGVGDLIVGNGLYELIYEYTNRYIPANAQPRKSILIMDAMIGWYRSTGRPFDDKLLADVMYESEGVNVAFRANAADIRKKLDQRVLSQKFATKMIEQRLQICIADLNNKKRPMSSFLFSGSSGVGKALRNSELIPVFNHKSGKRVIRNGDIQVGDFVFNRPGYPVEVAGVYPQGLLDEYEVELEDGRKLICGAGHLWTYRSCSDNNNWRTSTVETLMEQINQNSGGIRYVIPMNQPVQWPDAKLDVHPYVLGAFLASGLFCSSELSLDLNEEFVVSKCSALLGLDFRKDGNAVQTRDVFFGDCEALPGKDCCDVFIPDCYKYGSVSQRWQLIQGLFDSHGCISQDSRFDLSFCSKSLQLLRDVQYVLYSLGISSRIMISERSVGTNKPCHELLVYADNSDKFKFFTLPRKLELSYDARMFESSIKPVNTIGIRGIRKLNTQSEMTCIFLKDDEHLYQAGDFIVTHNTEVTKSLAQELFGSEDAMLRYDMTEFANPDSLERFRSELTNRVWARPFSILLLDEIEKACAPVTRLLLQVLDDGRLSDENNRIVSFLNCYIVMTTNAGSEVYQNISQYNVDDAGSGENIMQYYKVIRRSISSTTGDNRFPPELLGRIDVIVPFQPLSEATMKDIAAMNLKKMRANVMQRHNVDVRMDKKLIRYLVEDNLDTNSDSGGARVVISKLESEITIPIAKFINENPLIKCLKVVVEGELVRDNPDIRVSDAHVVIYPVTR